MAICALCEQELTCGHRSRKGKICGMPMPCCNCNHRKVKWCCHLCLSYLSSKAWFHKKQVSRLREEEMHLNRLVASQEANLTTLINRNQALTSAIRNLTEENKSLKAVVKFLQEQIQFLTGWDSVPGYDSSGDVILFTHDGGRFKVHRSILAGRSVVFKAMLNSGMKESKNMRIHFYDVNEEALSIFLKFLYKAEIDPKDFQQDGEEKAEMIIRLSQQYQIDFLLYSFQNFMVKNIISVENVESILDMAYKYQLEVVETAINDSSRWAVPEVEWE